MKRTIIRLAALTIATGAALLGTATASSAAVPKPIGPKCQVVTVTSPRLMTRTGDVLVRPAPTLRNLICHNPTGTTVVIWNWHGNA